ncbi:MAG: hypothetical protein KBB37_10235 [Bacteroidia bacterium]|nr:hypothetical protein [Bacteroidia bacterium]MBP7261653.1 hypothetical protein [Bacteroidia bacterium]MBP9180067.1 hypothetical protein [Bacteroidia bacterium]MBP9725193.1 hypothetical protein [Bacteroidia bacterium]
MRTLEQGLLRIQNPSKKIQSSEAFWRSVTNNLYRYFEQLGINFIKGHTIDGNSIELFFTQSEVGILLIEFKSFKDDLSDNVKQLELRGIEIIGIDELEDSSGDRINNLIVNKLKFPKPTKPFYINHHEIDGWTAFEFYDTFGFPLDLTQLIAKEESKTVDIEGFNYFLEKQKSRSRKSSEVDTEDWVVIGEEKPTQFLGYDTTDSEVNIIKFRKVKAKGKEQFQLVFNQTPFYPEGGGQVGDTGYISNANEKVYITDTKKENNLIIHFAAKLPENIESNFTAVVDTDKRNLTENNHSATHLLHAALRKVLGTHVQQKGSLVNNEYLRFDFSHFSAMTAEEITEVEKIVNRKIRENIALDERRNVPIAEAQTMGAMMLFGEKYGESVRVITFDEKYSRELCGGTHVKATGQIGLFKIISESAVAAGVRRVEAITAVAAEELVNSQQNTVNSIKELLKAKDPVKSVEQLLHDKADLLKRLEVLEGEKTQVVKAQVKQHLQAQNGLNVLIAQVDVPNAEQLKNLSFQLKQETENLFCVLGTVIDGKPLLSVMISDILVKEKNLHAGNIIKELAKEIQGGGGGQPFYATAGGTKVEGLASALQKAKTLI